MDEALYAYRSHLHHNPNDTKTLAIINTWPRSNAKASTSLNSETPGGGGGGHVAASEGLRSRDSFKFKEAQFAEAPGCASLATGLPQLLPQKHPNPNPSFKP